MSCSDCNPDHSSKTAPDHALSPLRRSAQIVVNILPEGSALLSCSCCWLPTVLDFLFAGSVAAAGVKKLQYVFMVTSLLSFIWTVRREGLGRRLFWRVSILVGLFAWTQVNRSKNAVGNGQHSCH
ncbi:unnamed protein product [Penicillium salamii]|uniref:Uncharacterized protein n=1 Tax=Penicillium salamii TaxID=1612424 RepID=A0A9W4NJG1_9EURO|nr:unnamed protein product [Penicillium salamii]CAG8103076.1 unnamed protein product [Penicillium salamii]CAG8376351.1 unnamed protein product [Penicillium salamii]CAG8378008.1 unnamed protein product [Penicillium salamii]CAG8379686.1 unnamed protein product [Penicillium salamii]